MRDLSIRGGPRPSLGAKPARYAKSGHKEENVKAMKISRNRALPKAAKWGITSIYPGFL